jgi:hypothetical protein
MNASYYTVKFVGGPSDGLVLRDPHFDVRDKLQMPVAPAYVRSDKTHCYELVGYWSTAYLLTSKHRTIEGGQMTTYLSYDFLGYELLRTRTEWESQRQCTPHWLIGMRDWFSQARGAFVKWMLEPIDHPLKVSDERASLDQRVDSPRT